MGKDREAIFKIVWSTTLGLIAVRSAILVNTHDDRIASLPRLTTADQRIPSMKLSVIVPTYNQAQILPKSIHAIFHQTLSLTQYELLLINDGSSDETEIIVEGLARKYPFRYFTQANRGPAAARNKGIKEARNEVVVLIQDDMIATPNLLAEHLRFHKLYPQEKIAVVGFTTWSREIKITPFMHWLEHGGPQFDYDRIKGQLEVDHLAFYTCNLSLNRQFLLKNGLFDESFYVAGSTAYEDIELGWRLQKKGLKILYNSQAIAYHYHPKTLKSVCQRRFFEGELSHKLYQKHPDFKMHGRKDSLWYQVKNLKTAFFSDHQRFLITSWFLNKSIIWPWEKLAYFVEDKFNFPLLFKLVCGYHYLRGMRQGKLSKITSSPEGSS